MEAMGAVVTAHVVSGSVVDTLLHSLAGLAAPVLANQLAAVCILHAFLIGRLFIRVPWTVYKVSPALCCLVL